MPSVQTVTGPIDGEQMGLTLTHEHVFIDLRCYWSGEPEDPSLRELYSRPVSPQNRNEVVYNSWAFKDNTFMDDMESAIDEVASFAAYGGGAIVDVTATAAMGRNPQALRRVSEASGVHIIMSSGRYSEPSISAQEKSLSVGDLEKRILDEFAHGAEGSGIKPGVVKVAFNDLNNPVEMISLRAGARAQAQIGCALVCHSLIWSCANHAVLDILEEEGADLRRVILAHQDFTAENWQYHDSLIQRGVYLEYDTFGCEAVADPADISVWFYSDREKIHFVKKQIELGNTAHLLISGDMCLKMFFKKWGGWGYSHIPQHIIPRMLRSGVAGEQIHQITVENPKRVFSH